MKHIKLCKQFLNEMERGNALFSKDWKNREWRLPYDNNDFIRKLNKEYSKYKDEDNTQDEQEFLNKLWLWIEEGDDRDYFTSNTNINWLYKHLKTLLKLKKKFPLVLDPLKARSIGKNVYRGTTLDSKIILDAMKKGKVSLTNKSIKAFGKAGYSDFVQIEGSISVDLKSIEKKKAASFSTNFPKAYIFSQRHNLSTIFVNTETGEQTVPSLRCTISVPSNSPNLLFNPDFMDLFSAFFEQEMWYVSDRSVKINGIYLDKRLEETDILLKKAGIEF